MKERPMKARIITMKSIEEAKPERVIWSGDLPHLPRRGDMVDVGLTERDRRTVVSITYNLRDMSVDLFVPSDICKE